MTLTSPVVITPRLLPGLQIGGAWISIEYAGGWDVRRQAYRWHIDLDGAEYTGDDLASGVGGGTLQEGLESLLSFLGAFAESVNYAERTGHDPENIDLFPAALRDWAAEHEDDLAMACCELEESDTAITE